MAISISIPAGQAECLGSLVSSFRAAPFSDAAIDAALHHPIWPAAPAVATRQRCGRAGADSAVEDCIQPGESVCLVVSDQTRKTAVDRILPVLLRRLTGRGCKVSDFFVLVATGIHRPPTAEELGKILGADMAAVFTGRIFLHNPDDESGLIPIGRTRHGHEVCLNRRAVEASRLVLLGAATYHYHAGFGGGRKSLIPGLASRATIAYNHSLTLDPEQDRIRPGVEIGRLDDNPVAAEMLEGARLHLPDFIVNTVLTPDGQLAGVFAGDLDLAHRAACRLVEQIDRVDIRKKADFVVADAGGADNWIQAHKALFNAARAVQEAGRIILLAPCPEGLGNERFRYWVTRSTLTEIYRGLRQSSEVNGQTALSTRLRGARAILVTQLNARDVADLRIATAPDLGTAVRLTLDELARAGIKRPTYYLMPEAMAVVPFFGGT
ncbi:MAG: nickel-dependent lactate racemase [Verrucomicrobia bacterium]|nr:nickel-dependent lactate racemase [Verrucomicrobiota bacterium]MBU1735136.1 nickel-dependent lactate racemase [Verrucomicrobiota bacterium]MBU1855993.1 nickel-dependent lactate racemase [Verrucomicrobiota bacterium]